MACTTHHCAWHGDERLISLLNTFIEHFQHGDERLISLLNTFIEHFQASRTCASDKNSLPRVPLTISMRPAALGAMSVVRVSMPLAEVSLTRDFHPQ